MQESGFVHAAFTFSHESMLGRTGLRAAGKTLPPGALLTFLQKGLQYVGVEESLRQQQESSKKSGNNKKPLSNSSSALGSTMVSEGNTSMANNGDFSLLSPVVISAITRKNPPIQLTVPPAAAAAAVKARLAFEAKTNQQLIGQRDSLSHRSMEPPRIVETSIAPIVSSAPSDMDIAGEMDEQIMSVTPKLCIDPVASSAAVEDIIQSQTKQQPSQRKDYPLSGKDARLGETGCEQDESVLPLAEKARPSHSAMDALAAAANNQSLTSKRGNSEIKRSMKKQKSSKNASLEISNAAAPISGFTSLEHAAARVEAAESEETLPNACDDNRRSETTQQSILRQQDFLGDSDQFVDSRRNAPAHAGQQSGPPPTQVLPGSFVNGQMVERNRNGGFSSSNTSFYAVHDANGQSRTTGVTEDLLSQRAPAISSEDDAYATKDDEILTLNKHQSEVFMCAWNPVYTNLIATGSGDASARIWEMYDKVASAGLKGCKLLPHGIDSGDKKNKDVTTLEWSSDGSLLATGSYDGVARVWDRKGALIYTLRGHQGPIFSLKWNKRGNYLLSGSYDKTIIVWNVSAGGSSGFVQHQFRDHEAPALDVDWKDNVTFASCSTDRTVHIYNINRDTPIKVYSGHKDEVNAVKWDYSGKLLASCSDDCTAKVWEVESDRTEPLHDFVSHNQEIYTVKWSPTGPGSPHPDKIPLLATASFDGSIRLWNVQDGSCFRFFNQHKESVYSVAFSPSGDFLASGSLAGQMYIWNIEEDRYVKSYKGKGDIFEVAWNKEETRVAACFSSNVVAVIDFDRAKLPTLTGP